MQGFIVVASDPTRRALHLTHTLQMLRRASARHAPS